MVGCGYGGVIIQELYALKGARTVQERSLPVMTMGAQQVSVMLVVRVIKIMTGRKAFFGKVMKITKKSWCRD